MPEKKPKIKRADKVCKVLLDRVQLVARTWTRQLPDLPGFTVRRDSFVRPQTSIRTYPRVRNFKNLKTNTTVDAQYWAAPPWLEPVKLTAVGDDSKGLQRAELENVCRQFKWTRLLMAEIAFDFDEGSKVDRTFVLRHGLFGKSELVGGRFFIDLRYGTRHSSTMVRAYQKLEAKCFRVELELHHAWLRKFGINQLHDLSKLPELLCFSRIRFVSIDWEALADHLHRRGHPTSALKRAQSQAYSIHRTLNFLRSETGLVNVRRFLKPLRINMTIKRELQDWAKPLAQFLGRQSLKMLRPTPTGLSYGLPSLFFSRRSVIQVMDRDPYSHHVNEERTTRINKATQQRPRSLANSGAQSFLV